MFGRWGGVEDITESGRLFRHRVNVTPVALGKMRESHLHHIMVDIVARCCCYF